MQKVFPSNSTKVSSQPTSKATKPKQSRSDDHSHSRHAVDTNPGVDNLRLFSLAVSNVAFWN